LRKKEKVLVFCAHSDDQAIGAGGTLSKYAAEGKEITIVVFSFGEQSGPVMLLRRRFSASLRVKESQKAAKILGAKKTIFFGLKEGHFEEEFERKGLGRTVQKLISKQPSRIFTHAPDDLHPDHLAVHKIIMNAVDELHSTSEVYTFNIWSPLHPKNINQPRIYVDISHNFSQKMRALDCFQSQKLAFVLPFLMCIFFNFLDGLSNNCLFAERFYKVH